VWCGHRGSLRGTPCEEHLVFLPGLVSAAREHAQIEEEYVPTCWSEEDEREECSLTARPFCLGKDGDVGLKMDVEDGGKVATHLY